MLSKKRVRSKQERMDAAIRAAHFFGSRYPMDRRERAKLLGLAPRGSWANKVRCI